MRGRPLAFLLLVVGGWSGARFLSLLPDEMVRPLAPAPFKIVAPAIAAEAWPNGFAAAPARVAVTKAFSRASAMVARSAMRRDIGGAAGAPIAIAGFAQPVGPPSVEDAGAREMLAPAGLPPAAPDRPGRWSGSGWIIARDGGGGSLLSPLLGGSQAGLRLAYRLDDRGRVAGFARVATPLGAGPAELATGAQWRPTTVPVTLYAEVRAIHGQVAPAAGVFGGGSIALPASVRLEGYGQAGIIDRDGVTGFGDGQARLVRPVGTVELGAGVWAAAQRGAGRLDVGPSLALPVRLDPLALRLTLDWRHRIAGNARPAGGPVLSLGADF